MIKYHFFSLAFLLALAFSCSVYKYTPDIVEQDLSRHLAFLASDELEGRSPGTLGDSLAGYYIQERFREIGLDPQKQDFSFLMALKRGPGNELVIDSFQIADTDFTPLSFSQDTQVTAPVVFAGFGSTVKSDSFSWNDYEGIEVKNKWVLVLRGSPGIPGRVDYFSQASGDRDKAMLARDNGAAGLLLVSSVKEDPNDEVMFISSLEGRIGIPVMHISRGTADLMLRTIGKSLQAIELSIDSLHHPVSMNIPVTVYGKSVVEEMMGSTDNWFAILEGADKVLKNEFIVIGAHHDHLGMGGPGSSSRRPDTIAVHNGADDNASGVSSMLELADKLKAKQNSLKRSVLFIAFGAEEKGLLGSKYFVNHPPIDLNRITAMINLDMIGRLDTTKRLQVGGAGTSIEADSLIRLANVAPGLKLIISKEGSGPSDHSSFYGKGLPVFFITTGAHSDYHTPDDDTENLNIAGLSVVSDFVFRLVSGIDDLPEKLSFREAGPREGDSPTYRFKVTLGFMPDFSSNDLEGVRVDMVSKGKAAERGGIKNGDIITAIDGQKIKSIYDYMYRLSKLSKNQIISVELLRNGKTEVLIIQL